MLLRQEIKSLTPDEEVVINHFICADWTGKEELNKTGCGQQSFGLLYEASKSSITCPLCRGLLGLLLDIEVFKVKKIKSKEDKIMDNINQLLMGGLK